MVRVSKQWSTIAAAVAVVAAASLVALPATALPGAGDLAEVSFSSTQVQWVPNSQYAGMSLTLSGPQGIVERHFDGGESPLLNLSELSSAPDGQYTWELRATPVLSPGIKSAVGAARANGEPGAGPRSVDTSLPSPDELVMSGSFRVVGGAIVGPGLTESPAPHLGVERRGQGGLSAATGGVQKATAADQVIPDDLIVQGSICVGLDCVNNESFGFDTIRLKENNTRIKFEDTSVGSFPSSDWQLTANESASGGQNKFSIDDISGSKVPFTIEAGAATNSLVVDSTSRIGLRTATPVLDLHINTSNTPGIRLEQNTSGGFAAQTWDIAGNEANFFVRDVTGGSKLSFRIRPGAPTSSIDISASGDVGIGTASPSAPIHVSRTDGSAQVRVEEGSSTEAARELAQFLNNGTVTYRFTDTQGTVSTADDFNWLAGLKTNNRFIITPVGTIGAPLFEIDSAGNVTATAFTPSSRELKEDFSAVDGREILSRVVDLPLSTWKYKRDQNSLHLGPMAEDFYSSFGLGKDQKSIGVVDVSGVALAAIQGLNQVVAEKDVAIGELRDMLKALEQQNRELADRLNDLEVRVESVDP